MDSIGALLKFGTDGIRGIIGTELTPSFFLQLGYWIGRSLQSDRPILIGNDSRQSCSTIEAALTAGLTSQGLEVWSLGLCPTPAIPVLIKKLQVGGGIMISASHNPPEYNGIKIFNSYGNKINNQDQQVIENDLLNKIPWAQNTTENSYNFGKVFKRNELLIDYFNSLLSTFGNTKLGGISIVLDLCWGSATAFSEKIFKELGANVLVINGTPNGELINLNCGSTNLNPLKKAVIENGAEIGFAFDGDADRMLAIDKHGRSINGDHLLYLWGSSLQEQKKLPKNMLIATIMSNLGFEKAWNSRGGLLERTPVGDQHVYAALIENGAALGGEQSGHILSSINGFCGDGLLTALQVVSICSTKAIKLSELREQTFEEFPQKLINIRIPDRYLKQNWNNFKPMKEIILKAEEDMGPEGRVFTRMSGTEPLLRIMTEAPVKEVAEYWAYQIEKVIINSLKENT